VYVSLVRPTLEYASSVWDPYQQNDIHRLEMVQYGLHDMIVVVSGGLFIWYKLA
jgi:hypothetical protein